MRLENSQKKDATASHLPKRVGKSRSGEESWEDIG